MDYGPTIAAAFASINENDTHELRTIILEMMKHSPSNSAIVGRYSSGSSVSSLSTTGAAGNNSYNTFSSRPRPATNNNTNTNNQLLATSYDSINERYGGRKDRESATTSQVHNYDNHTTKDEDDNDNKNKDIIRSRRRSSHQNNHSSSSQQQQQQQRKHHHHYRVQTNNLTYSAPQLSSTRKIQTASTRRRRHSHSSSSSHRIRSSLSSTTPSPRGSNSANVNGSGNRIFSDKNYSTGGYSSDGSTSTRNSWRSTRSRGSLASIEENLTELRGGGGSSGSSSSSSSSGSNRRRRSSGDGGRNGAFS